MADVAVADAPTTRVAPPVVTGLTGRAKAERKLGLMLCAPAIVVMLFVAGFPILYAFWLSLHRADLRFPSLDRWVGFDNYASVLTSHTWWQDVANTLIITVFSVTIELVLGMLIAQAMYRAITPGPGSASPCSCPTGRSRSSPRSPGAWPSIPRRDSCRRCST